MIDPFWHKVQEAYNIVSKEHGRRITVEMNGLKASVIYTEDGDYVAMKIEQVPFEQPVLISPGQGKE